MRVLGRLFPSHVTWLEKRHDVLGLIDALSRGRRSGVRRKAAEALGRLRDDRAVEPLIAALRDADPELQRIAALVLGDLGDGRATESLAAATEEASMAVRAAAIRALGKQPDVRANARAIEALSMAAKNHNSGIRRAAVEALGSICPEQIPEGLLLAMQDPEWNVRQAGASAMVKMGEKAVEPLIALLGKEAGAPSAEIVRVLGQLGDRRAVQPLLAALAGAAPGMRQEVAAALGGLGGDRSAAALVALLADPKKEVRLQAARSLGQIGWQPADDKTKARYLIAKEDYQGAQSLGEPAVEALIGVLGDDSENETVHRSAIRALGSIGSPRAVAPLMELLKTRHGSGAAEALAGIGQPAVEPLVSVLPDPNRFLRQLAAGALSKLNWQPDRSEAAAYYWIGLGRWDNAADLGSIAVAPLIAALHAEPRETYPKVIQALKALYDSDQLDAHGKQRLLALQGSVVHSHDDHTDHTDGGECSESPHSDYDYHHDIPENRVEF